MMAEAQSEEDRIIQHALAAGKVTRCPPRKAVGSSHRLLRTGSVSLRTRRGKAALEENPQDANR